MSQQSKLLSEALKLPTPARAKLAAQLIASVDGEPDVDVDAAWGAEIEDRVRRLERDGLASTDDAEVVLNKIAARFRKK